jgi:hypothetical protein
VWSQLNRGCRFAFAALLGCVALVSGAGGVAEARDPRWVEDELLVRVQPGARAAGLALLASEGATTERQVSPLDVTLVRVPPGRRTAAQQRLRASGRFRFVERNYVARAAETPDDPEYPAQWALPRLQAPQVWDLSRGLGVTIAVVDSGVDASHPDLGPQLVAGFNAIDGSEDTADDHGHGTRMAGIAAARGFDGFGVVGLAPEASLMPVKSLDASGHGTYADVARGIVEAVDRGARVINLSLGGDVASFTLSSAVDYAISRGVVVVAAAGNSGTSAPTYPAGYADVLAVGASAADDRRASFSNYGPWLDLVAPGVGIRTTDLGGGFADSSGTSPAAPLVAAAAALVLAANPALQPSQVATILSMTSADVGSPGFDEQHGWGRVAALNAVEYALALAGQPDAAAPVVAWQAPADGATAEGVVTLEVLADDDVGVARVEYTLDGVVVAVATEPPFAAAWDSATAMPGPHLLGASAYDGSGNQGVAPPRTLVVAGDQATCATPGWACLPGGGTARTDCFSEWLVRAESVVPAGKRALTRCVDGSSCDADGVADGVCTVAVGLCFSVDDPRLLDKSGAPVCEVEDLLGFQLLAPGFRRVVKDSTDAANVQSVLTAVAALGTGQAEGRCVTGARGLDCGHDLVCDSTPGMHDGVCGYQRAPLAGLGGVERCTAVRQVRVPLRGSVSKRRKGVRVFKVSTTGLTPNARRPRDGDALRLECLPAV